MARTKRRGRAEQCYEPGRSGPVLSGRARQEERRSEERRRWRRLARQARKEEGEKKQPSSPVHHPSPAKSSSPAREVVQALEEMIGQVEEANRLVEVGPSPLLLPTQQLAQMAAEAGPSALGEEPAQRKSHPTIGGKGPMEGVPEGRKGQEAQEVLAWHSCHPQDQAVSEEY